MMGYNEFYIREGIVVEIFGQIWVIVEVKLGIQVMDGEGRVREGGIKNDF